MARSASTREEAGAGYTGALALSGNLYERSVTAGNATGRLFDGLHGDGNLNSTGEADVSNWPGADAVGSCIDGGSWYAADTLSRVSDRGLAGITYSVRKFGYGGRLARSVP